MEVNNQEKSKLQDLKQKINTAVINDTISDDLVSELRMLYLGDAEVVKEIDAFLSKESEQFKIENKNDCVLRVKKLADAISPLNTVSVKKPQDLTDPSSSSDSFGLITSSDDSDSSVERRVKKERKSDLSKEKKDNVKKEKKDKVKNEKKENPKKGKIEKDENTRKQEKEERKRIKEEMKAQNEALKAQEKEERRKRKEFEKDEKRKLKEAQKEEKKLKKEKKDQKDFEASEGLTPAIGEDVRALRMNSNLSENQNKELKMTHNLLRQKIQPDLQLFQNYFDLVPLSVSHDTHFLLDHQILFPSNLDVILIQKRLSDLNPQDFEDLEKQICSLLNTKGGAIFFGIDPRTKIVQGDTSDIRSVQKFALKLAMMVEDGFYPSLPNEFVRVDVVNVLMGGQNEGASHLQQHHQHHVFRVAVERGEAFSLYCTQKGRYFYRKESELNKYTPKEVQEIIANNASLSRGEQISQKTEIVVNGKVQETKITDGNDSDTSSCSSSEGENEINDIKHNKKSNNYKGEEPIYHQGIGPFFPRKNKDHKHKHGKYHHGERQHKHHSPHDPSPPFHGEFRPVGPPHGHRHPPGPFGSHTLNPFPQGLEGHFDPRTMPLPFNYPGFPFSYPATQLLMQPQILSQTEPTQQHVQYQPQNLQGPYALGYPQPNSNVYFPQGQPVKYPFLSRPENDDKKDGNPQ